MTSETNRLESSSKMQAVNNTKARKLAEFYENKVVLITGATGFIGKICLLKLMSSLGNCKKVYIMLRSKKGLTPQQRFNKMLQEAPFNRDLMNFDHFPNPDEMRKTFGKQSMLTKPIDWSKVEAVEGDMSRANLGVNEQVAADWCKSINIVFNIAASVQFDAPLKENYRTNYLGAGHLLKLATNFEALISFVHVSTFYTNSHINHIEEKVLPLSKDCEEISELISSAPDAQSDNINRQFMENRPNTYIFTKAMAENLIRKYEGTLPVAILRPSIVVTAAKEPEPGWVDSVNGPMGLSALASVGIVRNVDWNYWGVCDFIPVDHVVNAMLAVAERTPRLYPNEIKVYNCSSSSLNPLTYGACFEKLKNVFSRVPSMKMLRIPIEPPKHKRANKIGLMLTKINELLFAYLIDLLLAICGQKRILVKLTKKLHRGYDMLTPFMTTQYTCSNDNLMEAFENLDDEDKNEFDFNIKKLDWDQMIEHAAYGARKRLLKEDLSNVRSAIFKMRILTVVEFIFKVMFYCYLSWLCYGFINSRCDGGAQIARSSLVAQSV